VGYFSEGASLQGGAVVVIFGVLSLFLSLDEQRKKRKKKTFWKCKNEQGIMCINTNDH